ncbi:unnamed protein product [Albugo candida]|nr:unnamed protein product [Albugo candida]|eukprot:CCI45398.1 unnamed protein product [Albugo candida]
MCHACWVTIKNSDKVECFSCRSAFHFHCANVPTGIHPSQFFCTWACLTNVKKINDNPQALHIDFEVLMRNIQKLSESRDRQRKAVPIDDGLSFNQSDISRRYRHTASQYKRKKITGDVVSDLQNAKESAPSKQVKVSAPKQRLPKLTAITGVHPRHDDGKNGMKTDIAAGDMVRPMQRSPHRHHQDKPPPPTATFGAEQRTKHTQATSRNAEKSNGTEKRGLTVQRANRNVPWMNIESIPQNLTKRFICAMENENSIFRVDLTPTFSKMHYQLEQEEIDFFFRCLESPGANLIVKGMNSGLNQYVWLWPFVLESCGLDTRFIFDRFYIIQCNNGSAELKYVGEIVMTLGTYQTYLEGYSSKLDSDQEIVALDCATKSAVFIRVKDNIIALNALNITKHCTQLHRDLVQSFQWDLFPGGIHCLLQYTPQDSHPKHFKSTMLHINVPGARGRLTDPGNGTTDFAFMASNAFVVLSGCVEIVIFDRLEPRKQKALLALLMAAGAYEFLDSMYPQFFSTMILFKNPYRAAGYTWSTVLVYEDEFININKGRMHFWRVVESQYTNSKSRSPCVFLTWEWIYQGVSQQGILTECWFAITCSRLASGRHHNPRRAIIEAVKRGLAIVRCGFALTTDSVKDIEQWSFAPVESLVIPKVIQQRHDQMKMFLESLYPCLEAIIQEEMQYWGHEEVPLQAAVNITEDDDDASNFVCDLCDRDLINGHQLCLGCLACSQQNHPRQIQYKPTRLCFQCHSNHPKEHHRKRLTQLRLLQLPLMTSAALLNSSVVLQNPLMCECEAAVRCASCTACVLCECSCHTRFQIRYRLATPGTLERLKKDVKCVIEYRQHNQ